MKDKEPLVLRVASDKPFLIGLGILGGSYLLIIVSMVLADLFFLNYVDKPVLGNEMVRQGRHIESGVIVPTEKGRRYFFRAGKNEKGLRLVDGALLGTGLFIADSSEVVLISIEQGKPVTASLRPEVRLKNFAITNNVATLTTDEPHGLLWGEFIRVSSSDEVGWDGIREVTETTSDQLSFMLEEGASLAGSILISKPNPLIQALRSRDIRFSIKLSLISCTLTTLFSLWVAVPIGYLMSRFQFRGKALIDTLLDIPIVLPPLVVG